MTWIFLAILAHMGNALVFVVDKSLLHTKTTSLSRPLHYTFYSSVVAGAALVLLPFGYESLLTQPLLVLGLTGCIHILALWTFFAALKEGEPSRVVPMIGAFVPLFTLLAAVLFLQEVLSGRHVVGFIGLILGSIFLTIHIQKKSLTLFSHRSLLPLVSAALFAMYFALMKYAYDHTAGFITVFVYSRVIESAIALVALGPWVAPSLFHSSSTHGRRASLGSSLVFLGNKVLAAGAFLLQHYALMIGSVSVVSALQGIQYVFLFILTTGISLYRPSLFQEELRSVPLAQKIIGVACVCIAIAFLI